jgi:hypothetical protein
MPNSEETVAVLMEQMDPDGSGTLDWEEFKILVKQVIGCLLQDVNGTFIGLVKQVPNLLCLESSNPLNPKL